MSKHTTWTLVFLGTLFGLGAAACEQQPATGPADSPQSTSPGQPAPPPGQQQPGSAGGSPGGGQSGTGQ